MAMINLKICAFLLKPFSALEMHLYRCARFSISCLLQYPGAIIAIEMMDFWL